MSSGTMVGLLAAEGMPFSIVLVAATCLAVIGAFGVRSRKLDGYQVPLVLGWTALFAIVYIVLWFALADGVTYTTNLVLSLGFVAGFAILFAGGGVSERLALVVSCLLSIMITRSLVTSVFWFIEGGLVPTGQPITYAYYVALYLFPLLVALFYLRYPVRPAAGMPAVSRYLLLAIPVCMAIISQAQILLNTSGVLSITWEMLLFQALALVAMLASYYLTCMVTRAYDQLMEEQQVSQRLELSLDHVQRSGAIVDQVRRDKHELKNNYLYMSALLAENRLDELAQFLNVEMVEHFDELTEFHTGNETLDYLLAQKASEARKTGARVYFEVVVPADLGLSDRELCGLLGNLLDNAIDASRAEVEAGNEAEVRLTMRTVRSYLSIKVQNRSSKNVLRANPHLHTTKSNASEHGIGLKVVRSIVAQHGGSFETEMEGGNFVATVLLEL